jgi:Tfp pilus assembly protein PilF
MWGGSSSATTADAARSKYQGLASGATTTAPPGSSSLGLATPENPLLRAWKSTTAAFSSKPKPPDDPTSLSTSPKKISADVYIASGRLLESQQKLDEAQAKYEAALKVEPKNLTAMVSLARLHDRAGRFDKAVEQYQQALQAHPKSALVHNDLGLCYARRRDLPNAAALLSKAVQLEPSKANYRNNLAAVLVDLGRPEEALVHLQAAHPAAVAHFNLACLMAQREQIDLAIAHLEQAVQIDPLLAPAQEMLAQLHGAAQPPMEAGLQIAARPAERLPQQAASPGAATADATESAIQAQPMMPVQEPQEPAEPIYRIGSEGIESAPASASEGPNIYQPTTHQSSQVREKPAPAVFHIGDDEEEALLVATHLIYGVDDDPAPEPKGLVDDEPAEAEADQAVEASPKAEPADDDSEETENVRPIEAAPILYPVVE